MSECHKKHFWYDIPVGCDFFVSPKLSYKQKAQMGLSDWVEESRVRIYMRKKMRRKRSSRTNSQLAREKEAIYIQLYLHQIKRLFLRSLLTFLHWELIIALSLCVRQFRSMMAVIQILNLQLAFFRKSSDFIFIEDQRKYLIRCNEVYVTYIHISLNTLFKFKKDNR